MLLLVGANAVSQLGNVVAVVALPWFVLETTGSAARTGVTAFAATAPLALGALSGGAVVARIGPRLTSVLGDLVAALAIAGIPALHAVDRLAFWHVLLLAFLAGAADGPGRAARRAMVPVLADRAGMPLERANAIGTTSEHIGYVTGAPLAGAAIALVGAPGTLWLDAASFLVSAALVAVLPVTRATGPRPRLRDGVAAVRRDPLLSMFFAIWAAGSFLIGPIAAVVLPVYARTELGGAGALAAAVTAYGVGGMLGTAAYGIVGRRTPRRPFFVAVWVVYPVLTYGLVVLPSLWWFLSLLLAIGFVTGAYDPFEVTLHQELAPSAVRAHVFGLLLAMESAVMPLGMLAYGFVMDRFGLTAALVGLAVGNTVLGTYAITSRPGRRLPPPREVG